jgi:hypothetical protein
MKHKHYQTLNIYLTQRQEKPNKIVLVQLYLHIKKTWRARDISCCQHSVHTCIPTHFGLLGWGPIHHRVRGGHF